MAKAELPIMLLTTIQENHLHMHFGGGRILPLTHLAAQT